MKILILGGDGMLGHQLLKYLRRQHEVRVTLRQTVEHYSNDELFNPNSIYPNIDVRSLENLLDVVADFQPEAIINAVGIIKQRHEAKEYIPSLEINAILPHRLASLCKAINSRFVQISTDCVFSGIKGNYKESDTPDPPDLYGQTKLLGEVTDTHSITLRTSIIGRELSRKTGLLEWLLAQQGQVKGFRKAIFSGFTTIELSRIIEKILVDYPHKAGVYQVSSEPISKYDLLNLIKESFGLDIEILPDDIFQCDRSLDSSRFRDDFNYTPPSWEVMVNELSKQYKRN
jgi:dTDP-4-dehydrorhamnose reductase